mmetsp:Transcript_23991/g.66482  ORF Transcript_23991/g.66482 Transcript_23991/m.66482 type:complete len:243 (+) Transcript_23991:539-1267(+)
MIAGLAAVVVERGTRSRVSSKRSLSLSTSLSLPSLPPSLSPLPLLSPLTSLSLSPLLSPSLSPTRCSISCRSSMARIVASCESSRTHWQYLRMWLMASAPSSAQSQVSSNTIPSPAVWNSATQEQAATRSQANTQASNRTMPGWGGCPMAAACAVVEWARWSRLRRHPSSVNHVKRINKSSVSGATTAEMSRSLKTKKPPMRSRAPVAAEEDAKDQSVTSMEGSSSMRSSCCLRMARMWSWW